MKRPPKSIAVVSRRAEAKESSGLSHTLPHPLPLPPAFSRAAETLPLRLRGCGPLVSGLVHLQPLGTGVLETNFPELKSRIDADDGRPELPEAALGVLSILCLEAFSNLSATPLHQSAVSTR